MSRVLLLGGSGFVGSRIQEFLSVGSNEVFITSTEKKPARPNVFSLSSSSVDFECQFDRVISESRPDVVIDLVSPNVSPRDRRSGQTELAQRYVAVLRKNLESSAIPALVHVSTELAQSTQSQDSYIQSKLIAVRELAEIEVANLVSTVYLPRIFGPGEPAGRFISDLIADLIKKGHTDVREPSRIREFMSVDVASLRILSAAHKLAPLSEDARPCNFKSVRRSLAEVATFIFELLRDQEQIHESTSVSFSKVEETGTDERSQGPQLEIREPGLDVINTSESKNCLRRSFEENLELQVLHEVQKAKTTPSKRDLN
jgi:nucleoside-diphosphate-sugar epimerase